MANRSAHVILQGGEDLVSSGIQIQPGRAQVLHNYACDINGGYSKIQGYVAYNGKPITLTFTTGDGAEPGEGEIVTIGDISGTITSVDTTSGTWAGGDAAGTITIEHVYGGSSAPSTGTASFSISTSSSCSVTVVAAPGALTGSGSVKGVWVWDNTVYAVRSNGTIDILYKSSSTGWTAAPLGYKVAFTAGGGGSPSPIPLRGDTLTKGGVTATISGVAVTSGDFVSAGDAAGYLYIHTVAGGNFTAGAATYDGNAVTLSGAETANALGDGDRYEFRNENFTGSADGLLMYFVNGVNQAFEYDGSALVTIFAGRVPDTPTHLETHNQRLFLAYPGGDIMFSGPGDPTTGFTQDYTAGSVNVGDEPTGMQSMPGGVLAIFGEHNSKLLSGNISGADGDMTLKDHSRAIGAKEWTIQQMSDVYFVSPNGATSLYQTSKFGDFAGSGLSAAIEPLLRAYINRFTDSVSLKRKGQWRLYYTSSDSSTASSFIVATFSGGRMIGWSRGSLGFKLNCVNAGNIDGAESVFAGGTNGIVYKLDEGRNFDGADMLCGMILPYNPFGDPLVDKQWRKTIFQLDSSETFSFDYAIEFNYSAYGWARGAEQTDETKGGGAFWGLGEWGTFTWSGTSTYGTTELDTFGVGFNMALIITTNSDNIPDHNLRAYSAIYEPRRYVH